MALPSHVDAIAAAFNGDAASALRVAIETAARSGARGRFYLAAEAAEFLMAQPGGDRRSATVELRAIGIEVGEREKPERIGELMGARIATENAGTAAEAITVPARELVAAAAPAMANAAAGLAFVLSAMARLDRWDADAARICANRALSLDDKRDTLLLLPPPLDPEQAAFLEAKLPAERMTNTHTAITTKPAARSEGFHRANSPTYRPEAMMLGAEPCRAMAAEISVKA